MPDNTMGCLVETKVEKLPWRSQHSAKDAQNSNR